MSTQPVVVFAGNDQFCPLCSDLIQEGEPMQQLDIDDRGTVDWVCMPCIGDAMLDNMEGGDDA